MLKKKKHPKPSQFRRYLTSRMVEKKLVENSKKGWRNLHKKAANPAGFSGSRVHDGPWWSMMGSSHGASLTSLKNPGKPKMTGCKTNHEWVDVWLPSLLKMVSFFVCHASSRGCFFYSIHNQDQQVVTVHLSSPLCTCGRLLSSWIF